MKKFLPKGGLAFKTFAFALILMTAVMVMTLGILYSFLPRYYFTHMTNQLDRNAEALIQEIMLSPNAEDTLQRIAGFSAANNAMVMSFAEDGMLLMEFSSLFTSHNRPMLNIGRPSDREPIFIETLPDITEEGRQEPMIPFSIVMSPLPGGFDSGETLSLWNFSTHQPVYVTTMTTQAGRDFAVFGDGYGSISFTRVVSHPEIDHISFTSTLQPIDQARDVILAMIPYLAAAGFVIALLVAFIFSRHLTRPIIKIADAAAEMRLMTPGVVSGINSNDEVGRLSKTLDKLYQDLCANIEGLQTEMEKTTRLERSKTDLMRAAGHELKTPIAALSGMLDGMIDKVGAYKDRDKYLPELKTQTERLSKLVNEILVASQTEEAGNGIAIAAVDIRALINETVEQYLPLVEKKGLHLNISTEEGFLYDTDRRVLSIALSNLLSNAVKYTPEGGDVSIGADMSADGNVIFIENRCPDVDPAAMARWFEPFYTPDYSRDKSKGGTGLGLYIVKRNLDALGLPFEISAEDGVVSFVISFP